MLAARTQFETPKRRRLPRELSHEQCDLTEEDVDLFALKLATALGIAFSRPGAFDSICRRIDELMEKARAGR